MTLSIPLPSPPPSLPPSHSYLLWWQRSSSSSVKRECDPSPVSPSPSSASRMNLTRSHGSTGVLGSAGQQQSGHLNNQDNNQDTLIIRTKISQNNNQDILTSRTEVRNNQDNNNQDNNQDIFSHKENPASFERGGIIIGI